MTEIERILNDAMALPNINNGNPLRHNDDLYHHQIVILLEVVNDLLSITEKTPCLSGLKQHVPKQPQLIILVFQFNFNFQIFIISKYTINNHFEPEPLISHLVNQSFQVGRKGGGTAVQIGVKCCAMTES